MLFGFNLNYESLKREIFSVKIIFVIISLALPILSMAAENDCPEVYPKVPAKENSVPWVIALLHSEVKDNLKAQFCAGTIISPFWVITAAHCVLREPNIKKEIDVLVGTQDLKSGGYRKHVDPKDIIYDTDFNPVNYDNDIALIRLENPICGQKYITLVKDEKDEQHVVDTKTNEWLYVSGWGNDQRVGENHPAKINVINVKVIDRKDCTELYIKDQLTDNMLCAGYEKNNFCFGDSGGPLFSQYGTGEVNVQIGLVSSIPRNPEYACGADKNYGRYTRLFKYKKWIEENSVKPYECKTQSPCSSTPIYPDR